MPLLSINHSCLTGRGKTDIKVMLLTLHFAISTADFNPLSAKAAYLGILPTHCALST